MHTISVPSAPWGVDASPLWGICLRGNFPENVPCATEADWSLCGFASVSHIAAVAAVQSAAMAYRMPRSCRPSAAADRYVSRMDYYKIVGIEHEEPFSRHPEGDRFLPLSQIEEFSANDVASRLRSTVTSHLSFSDSAIDMMDYAFGEVLDNVLQHAKAPCPGIACSQYYPSGNFVEVCIADCGRGIASSMAGNAEYSGLTRDELLAKSFDRCTGEFFGVPAYGSPNVSGGMGLWVAANVVRALDGHIWVVSRESAVDVSASGVHPLSGMYYPGTIVTMRFPVSDKTVSGDDVFGNGRIETARWTPSDSWWYEGSDDDVLW